MHSTTLRSSDFSLWVDGAPTTHLDFFADVCTKQRVGLVAPDGVNGVGAVTLVMAYVTAFYNHYRASGDDFFAYPDYYSFQSAAPVASYSMFDIWPPHKDVIFGRNASTRLNTINDRAINILILPDEIPESVTQQHNFTREQLDSAQRNITHCFAYTSSGTVENANIIIECDKTPLLEWAETVFEISASHSRDYNPMHTLAKKAAWQALHQDTQTLKQSFRRLSLDEALARL